MFSIHWWASRADPYLGSGTIMKVAKELQRNSVGYEIDLELIETIKSKTKIADSTIIRRSDAKRLRTKLQNNIEKENPKRNQNSSRN